MFIGSGGQSCVVGYPSPGVVASGVQAMPLFGPPKHVSAPAGPRQTGQGWMPVGQMPPGPQSASLPQVCPGGVVSPMRQLKSVSPARKISEESGATSSDDPSTQSPRPTAGDDRRLSTHVLVPGLFGLMTGNGAPKRHPVDVQLRSLPVSAAVAPKAVSSVPLQHTFAVLMPLFGTELGSGTAFARPPK